MSAVQIVPVPPRSPGPRSVLRSATAQDIAANIAVDAWGRLLGMIADGVRPTDAMRAVGATRTLVEGATRSNPERKRQWDAARLAASRRDWDVDQITEICNDIAAGLSVQSACRKRGKHEAAFVRLVLLDPALKEEYELARKIRAELWADESLAIADNEDQDLDLTGRGNMAAVKRSDLRVQTRRKLMADFSKERFGDKDKGANVNVQVNIDAAERLEAARARRNALRAEQAPVDAEFTPVEDWLA